MSRSTRRSRSIIWRIIPIVYVVLGVVIASQNDYFTSMNLPGIVNAILAILLWPLVLLGVDMHLLT